MRLKFYLLISPLITLLLTLLGVFVGISYMLIDQKEIGFIMGIVALASLIGLIPSFLMSQKVLLSLQLLVEKMQALSAGHFQKETPITSPLEFQQLDSSFNQMAQNLQESEQEKAFMVAQLAHDIKTPITSIQASIEGILDGVIHEDEVPHYLQTMLQQTKRLDHLVGKLDNLSLEVEQSQHPLKQTETVYLDTLILNVLAEHRLQIEQEGREVRVQVSPESAYIQSQYQKLYRIVDNLVQNALKYSPPGSPLSIEAVATVNRLNIAVQDQGQGIPSKEIPLIFKRFYRLENSRNPQTGGHGLGLYIAQELAQQLGGHIDVDSQEGKGSIFSLQIQLQPKDQSPLPKKEHKK